MSDKNIQVAGSKTVYDAIVVGSGITGGWAAKELTERGLKVLLLERGRHVEHIRDYILESFRSWHFPGGKQARRAHLAETHPVQRQCDAFNEKTQHFFVNDLEHPYETSPGKPFSWIRGYQLGGRSLTWARQSYRMGDVDFESNLRDGTGIDWPIRYRDLEPWYTHVERFIGVSGQAEGFGAAPDSVFQPPMAMNAVERAARDRVAQAYPDRRMTIGRVAVLTERLGKRYACIYRDRCAQGCIGGSYFSSLSSTLPAARATGNLEHALERGSATSAPYL
jgi:choline dehydrogenase-like flavoprotein